MTEERPRLKAMIFEFPADFAKQLKLAAVVAEISMKDYVMTAVLEKMEREAGYEPHQTD